MFGSNQSTEDLRVQRNLEIAMRETKSKLKTEYFVTVVAFDLYLFCFHIWSKIMFLNRCCQHHSEACTSSNSDDVLGDIDSRPCLILI